MKSTSNRSLAIVAITAAMLLAPVMDGLAKWLANDYSPWQVTWLRFMVHFLVFIPILLINGSIRTIWSVHWPSQFVRGLFLCGGVSAMFLGLRYIPIAEALGIFFISPLIVTMLAPWLLGEKVKLSQVLSVLAGFAGTLMVIQPGFESFQWAYLLPVLGGFCFAGYLLTSRKMANQSPVLVTHTISGLVGALCLAPIIPLVWKLPVDVFDWSLFISIGLVGAISHGLVLLAYSRAQASLLAPFAYVEIITGTAIGWFIFADFPNLLAWSGIAVIVASGIYVIYRS